MAGFVCLRQLSFPHLQKYLRGLWQTVLFQVLKDCPELAKTVCASLWSDADGLSASGECSENDLSKSTKTLPSQASLGANYSFFTNGMGPFCWHWDMMPGGVKDVSFTIAKARTSMG